VNGTPNQVERRYRTRLTGLVAAIVVLLVPAVSSGATRDVIVGHTALSEPLSVAPPETGGDRMQVFHRTLVAALERSHRFTIVPYDGPAMTKPEVASGALVPRGAVYLVATKAGRQGAEDFVEGYVLEAGRAVARFARRYTLGADGAQAVARRFADDVYRDVTGMAGFAASRVAYVADHEGRAALFTVGPDGADERRLVSGNFPCLFPKFAPSRNWLVYTAYPRGFPELYLVDVGSGKNHAVSSRPGLNGFGAVAPDGNQIAATLSFCGNPEIYLVSLTGKVERRVTRDRACDLSPDWSPDGTTLAYVNDASGAPQIYVVAADGATPAKRVTWPFNSSAYCVEPAWSPDGSRLAFCARVKGNFDVMVVDVASGAVTAVTEGGPDETGPSWAPDGRHVVVAVQDGQRTGLDVIDVLAPQNRFAVPLPAGRSRVRQPSVSFAEFDPDFNAWIAPFVMSAINTRVVQRSNALLAGAWGPDFTYDEAVLTGRGLKGRLSATGMATALAAFMGATALPPSRWALERFLLPAPGEGPSPEAQEKGFFDIRFHGTTSDGRSLRTKVTGDRDPGYGSTGKMLGEAAACLALDVPKGAVAGGFWTPSTIFGDRLIERLTAHAGLTFELLSG